MDIPFKCKSFEYDTLPLKLTISSQRHSLSPEIIEEIQCLRNWLGHQAITVGEVVSFGGDLMGWDGGEA
jgi:hypothetical protein